MIERHDHVRDRAEGGGVAVLVSVLGVVVRDRDGRRLVLLRDIDDTGEQQSLLAGSRGVGHAMGLEIVPPGVDDHPHWAQQRDELRQ